MLKSSNPDQQPHHGRGWWSESAINQKCQKFLFSRRWPQVFSWKSGFCRIYEGCNKSTLRDWWVSETFRFAPRWEKETLGFFKSKLHTITSELVLQICLCLIHECFIFMITILQNKHATKHTGSNSKPGFTLAVAISANDEFYFQMAL